MIFASSLYIDACIDARIDAHDHNRTALLQSGVFLFPFVFPGPLDLLISTVLLKIPVATVPRSRLPHGADSRQVHGASSNPSVFKYSLEFWSSPVVSDRSRSRSRSLSSETRIALAYSKSLPPPPSHRRAPSAFLLPT